MKNIMIIALMLTATTALNAQGNSNAQYMGSEKRPQDSVKSVYKDDPADHAHTETTVISTGEPDKNGGANGNKPSNIDNATGTGEPAVADNTTQPDGTTVTETSEEVTEACPDHIGTYAILMGIGGFILGLIVGFLVKGATDKNKTERTA